MPPNEENSLSKRIVVQDRHTRHFLRFSRDEKTWTESLDEAYSFANSGQAVLQCVKLKLDDVQIVITFGPRKYDLVLPIQEGRASTPRPER
jgi:hypothetical protein